MNKFVGKKPHILVDAQAPYAVLSGKKFKKKAKFYSVNDVCSNPNPEDSELFDICSANDYHIITQDQDFKSIKKSRPQSKVGIIKIVDNKPSSVEKNVTKLFEKFKYHQELEGKYISLTQSGVRVLSNKT